MRGERGEEGSLVAAQVGKREERWR